MTDPSNRIRILVVDDEAKLGRLVQEMLELQGHDVRRVSRGGDALTQLTDGAFDLVVTDLRMPDVDGLQVLKKARACDPPIEVIVMTAYGSAESAVEAMKAGAVDYLTKPFSMDELRIRVGRIVSQRRAEQQNEQLVEHLVPALVAESEAMRGVLHTARQVARAEATVLLLGESGTGKSQLARFIHFNSLRASGPFIEVHCAALPETLLESELFGFEKGAFTGADQKKRGLLASANHGTLFLDEIGEVPPKTQVKLLRFLQAREFVAIGSDVAERVDVRVLAATNADLELAVKEGRFREDLYYRLNVFPLEVPPLRARRGDVGRLTERFLSERGVPISKLSDAARARLAEHDWPGNVRELHNALERALILAADGPLEPHHLSLRRQAAAAAPVELESVQRVIEALLDFPEGSFDLDALERDLLHAAIARTGGNKAAAARRLGISRRRLYSRLKSLNEKAGDAED